MKLYNVVVEENGIKTKMLTGLSMFDATEALLQKGRENNWQCYWSNTGIYFRDGLNRVWKIAYSKSVK